MNLKKGILLFLLFIFVCVYLFNEQRIYLLPQPIEDVPMPTALHPTVEKNKNILIENAKEKGINVVITDGLRTVEEQDAIYARGRTESGNIVTYSQGGESFHNYGLAIDFALRLDNGDVIWDLEYDGNNNERPDWLEVVDIAKTLGFEWGGDWVQFKDYPHLQMDFGLSIWELKRGKRPRETETK